MNLRVFHVVFVVASTLLAAWLAAFCLAHWRRGEGGAGMLAGGVGAMVLAGVLAAYGSWFLRKTRNL
jgi:hypothetical protein